MDWTWYLFGFEGRINRAKLWLAGLIIVCWMIFLAALVVAVGYLFGGSRSFGFDIGDLFKIVDPASYRSLSLANLPSLFIKVVGTTLFLWVYFATSIKRLHDRDKSGWWMVPFFIVPGLYNQFADRLGDSYAVLPFGLVAFVFCLWGIIEMYFLKGSRKTNRFGANPLTPRDTGPRWEQHGALEFVPHSAGPSPGSHVKREA
jgi:uncharacterized membrane protein YhaH (DUF805 family)